MKYLRSVHVLFFLVFFLPALSCLAQPHWETGSLIWRDHGLLASDKLEILLHADYSIGRINDTEGMTYHPNFTPKYNEDDIVLTPMVAISPVKQLELAVAAPIRLYSLDAGGITVKGTGLGDATAMLRIAIVPEQVDPANVLSGIVGIRIPTGRTWNSVDNAGLDMKIPTGDGSLDFGFGAIYKHRLNADLALIAKLQYWINGDWESDKGNEYDYGDELFGILSFQYDAGDYYLRAGISLTQEAESSIVYYNGTIVPFEKNHRYALDFEALIFTNSFVVLRPRLNIPFDHDGPSEWGLLLYEDYVPNVTLILQTEFLFDF